MKIILVLQTVLKLPGGENWKLTVEKNMVEFEPTVYLLV